MKVVRKDFWKYISFGVFGMLGSSGTILADTFFVSNRLGAEGLAALNIAIAVFGLINGLGMMLGIGGATRYTICRSRKPPLSCWIFRRYYYHLGFACVPAIFYFHRVKYRLRNVES